MNKNQSVIIDWLTASENDFIDNIADLEGHFENVPCTVFDAFHSLSGNEFLESLLFSVDKSVSTKRYNEVLQ